MSRADLETGGDVPLPAHLQPPMANGEVIFDEPWQSRTFAMAVLLAEQKHFVWSEFQQQLITEIANWERSADQKTMDEYPYFEIFQTALLSLVASKNLLSATDVDVLAAEYSRRPHGHDHDHSHHDHSHTGHSH